MWPSVKCTYTSTAYDLHLLFTPMEEKPSNEKCTFKGVINVGFVAGTDDKDGMGLEFIEVKSHSFSNN